MLCQYLVFCWYYSWQKGTTIIILIKCCETNCWHLEPIKYLGTGLCVVADCSVLVFELSNSTPRRLTTKNGVCDGDETHHAALLLHWTAGMLLDVGFDAFTWIWTQSDSLLKFTGNLCCGRIMKMNFLHMPDSRRAKFWGMEKENTKAILGVEPYESC